MSLLPMKSGQLNMLGKKVITQRVTAKGDYFLYYGFIIWETN